MLEVEIMVVMGKYKSRKTGTRKPIEVHAGCLLLGGWKTKVRI